MLGNLYTVYGQDSLLFVTIASDNEQEHILTMKQGEAIQDLSGGNRLWILKLSAGPVPWASSFLVADSPSSLTLEKVIYLVGSGGQGEVRVWVLQLLYSPHPAPETISQMKTGLW